MKFWNYTIMLITLMIFLEFAGFTTGLGTTLNVFGISINSNTGVITPTLGNSGFWNFIFGTGGILIAIVGAIIIGSFTRSSPENYVILPLVTFLTTTLIQTFILVISYAINTGEIWVGALISIILLPLGAGFILSAVEFFRGTD